ncbi:L-fucose/L-arabinose isomerase family protein [Thermococcus atlanticus]
MKIGVVFGVSELANPKAFEKKVSKFLTLLAGEFEIKGGLIVSTRDEARSEELDFKDVDAVLIYPLTGGTENTLKGFSYFRKPVILYGDTFNNSIAAALELREYFRDRLIPSALVKSLDELKAALLGYEDMKEMLERFLNLRLGLIGRVSPWLINEKFELPYIHISLKKFYEYYEATTDAEGWKAVEDIVAKAVEIKEPQREDLVKAGRIYLTLKRIVEDYRLDGFTIGCFDLLQKLKGTPCLALAMFNAQGIPAACEGELNSLLGMAIARIFFNKPAFMGNIADYGDDYVILAHCTAPLIAGYSLRSHFESGIGVGVEVGLPKGRASLLKIRGRKVVVAGVEVAGRERSESRCRTQLRLKIEEAKDFMDGTLGNHHLLVYADSEELADLLSELGFEVMLY